MLAKLFNKYNEVILYLIFGVLTTCINIFVFWLFAECFLINDYISNAIAWILSVLFAYITNSKYVFNSKKPNVKQKAKEVILFYFYRILSGIIDMSCMYIFIDILFINNMISKIVVNIIVVVSNYIFSKFLIFKK